MKFAVARRPSPSPKSARAVSASLPAPIGGWNARDALAQMPQADAVTLENWFPFTTSVNLRNGFSRWSTGYPAAVNTILAYQGGATSKLFGISGTAVYEATAGGAVGAAVLSGLTNSKWQYVNIATPAGNYIWMCNGADSPVTFDGTTWANPAIGGVTGSTLIHVNLHKNRLWAIQNGTLKAWYLPVQSIAGTMQALDLSSFCTRGGYLMAMATWTIDAGYGVDDLAVFITSEGEVLVYRGTDPSSATTWALVGVWWLGSPIGRRCFVKFAGDVLIICEDGLLPLSGALESSRVQPEVAISYKIQSATSDAITQYSTNFGWQLLPFPGENMLFLNVPVQEGQNQQQYVMNTLTKSWCKYTGWNANCWELYNDHPYFGSGSFIGKAWDGTTDGGSEIQANALQAFSYFGNRAQVKRWTMMRPIFEVSNNPTLYANVSTDFDTMDTTAPLSNNAVVGSLWDDATWDSGTWVGNVILKNWQGTTGVGYCGAPRVKIAAMNMTVKWMSTDLVMEAGGIL